MGGGEWTWRSVGHCGDRLAGRRGEAGTGATTRRSSCARTSSKWASRLPEHGAHAESSGVRARQRVRLTTMRSGRPPKPGSRT